MKLRARIIVEGSNDVHALNHLLDARRKGIQIVSRDGCDRLREALSVDLLAGDDCLAIVVDADTDIAARWQSIGDALRSGGFETPQQPTDDVLLPQADAPPGTVLRLGLWMMPDNGQSSGSI